MGDDGTDSDDEWESIECPQLAAERNTTKFLEWETAYSKLEASTRQKAVRILEGIKPARILELFSIAHAQTPNDTSIRDSSIGDDAAVNTEKDDFIKRLEAGVAFGQFSRRLFENLRNRASCCAGKDTYHTVKLRVCQEESHTSGARKRLEVFCCRSDEPESWHMLRGVVVAPTHSRANDDDAIAYLPKETKHDLCSIRENMKYLNTSWSHVIGLSQVDGDQNTVLDWHLRHDGNSDGTSGRISPSVHLQTLLSVPDTIDPHWKTKFNAVVRANIMLSLGVALYEIPPDTWLPVEWKAQDIFFQSHCHSQQLQVSEFGDPFISTSFLRPTEEAARTNQEPDCNQSMLSFALLLLEIQAGEPITMQKHRDSDIESYWLTADTAFDRLKGNMTESVRNVLKACMQYKLLIANNTGASEEDKIRNVLLHKIIRPLYWEVKRYGEPIDERASVVLKSPRNTAPMTKGQAAGLYATNSRRRQPLPARALRSKLPSLDPGSCQSCFGSDVNQDVRPQVASICDGDAYSVVPGRTQDAKYASCFLERMQLFTETFIGVQMNDSTNTSKHQIEPNCWPKRNVRVAIIDSGLSNEPYIRGSRERIIAQKTWIGTDCKDECGHGTLVAGLLLKAAPCADLVIAKVTRGTNIPRKELHYISDAIQWAVNDHDADIISLSLALDRECSVITKTIENALNLKGKQNRISRIVVAAASNEGGNRSRAYPARMRGVVCVHASDGNGNNADFNPEPVQDALNLSTLGVDIPSFWNRKSIHISGTSYSTPIAAGVIASLLHFARQNMDLTTDELEILHSSGVAQRILQEMTHHREGFDFICPWRRKSRLAGQSEDQTHASLVEIVRWALFIQTREDA